MAKLERTHRTIFPYTIDAFDEKGAVKGELDLTKLSDEELSDLVFSIPEATSEIVYRELAKETNNTNE